jgi:hypothetical protein
MPVIICKANKPRIALPQKEIFDWLWRNALIASKSKTMDAKMAPTR